MSTQSIFIGMTLIVGLLVTSGACAGDGATTNYVVQLNSRGSIDAISPSKLSPALLAVKDCGGVLKGADELGKPIIAVPADNIEKMKDSIAVHSISAVLPAKWKAVKMLKLSYSNDNKLTSEDLKELQLILVEDYQKGAFMIVKPVDATPIDADLAAKLDNCPRVKYATPSIQVNASSTTQP